MIKAVPMTAPAPTSVRVFDSAGECPELPIIEGGGTAKAVVWPGNGATFRTMNVLALELGARTVELRHSKDCVYYVIEGEGVVVDICRGEAHALGEGNMVHIDAGDCYRLRASGSASLTVVGGPCPADEALYASLAP